MRHHGLGNKGVVPHGKGLNTGAFQNHAADLGLNPAGLGGAPVCAPGGAPGFAYLRAPDGGNNMGPDGLARYRSHMYRPMGKKGKRGDPSGGRKGFFSAAQKGSAVHGPFHGGGKAPFQGGGGTGAGGGAAGGGPGRAARGKGVCGKGGMWRPQPTWQQSGAVTTTAQQPEGQNHMRVDAQGADAGADADRDGDRRTLSNNRPPIAFEKVKVLTFLLRVS